MRVVVAGAGLAGLLAADRVARGRSRVGRALLTTWNDDPRAGESYSASTVSVADGDDELIARAADEVLAHAVR